MLKITLIALGHKMPTWVEQAVKEYAKRLRDSISLAIVEIPLLRRGKSADLARIMEKESALMQQAIPQGSHLIALDLKGQAFSSEQLADKLQKLQHVNSHLCFLIGGPEGLSEKFLNDCQERWSLSKLTLPHPLVRIIFLETIYRALCIINHHPYHK